MRTLSPSELDEAIARIDYLGYAVVPSVFSEAAVARLLQKVQILHSAGQSLAQQSGASANQLSDKYVYHLQFQDIAFLDILTRTNLLDTLKPFLNDPYYAQLPQGDPNFLLAYYNARSSVAPLALHIDSYVPSAGRFTTSMQIAVSLNGQTRQNGATTVVPGSHRIPTYPDRTRPELAEVIECTAGDVMIWDSRLWHGALENLARSDRWSLIATFRPWWMKQNYDPVRGTPDHIYQKMDDRQRALLGFLSLPAKNETEKISLKQGYADLLPSVADYRTR